MFGLRAISRRPITTFAVAGGAGACLLSYTESNRRMRDVRCEAPPIPPAGFKAVAERLGAYVKSMEQSGKLVFRGEKAKVKIYGVADEAAHVAAGGLPVVRVAQAIIKAPVEEVALCWWQAARRKEWDSVNTQDSQMVRSLTPTSRLVYLQAKPKKGGIVSSRDFCYVLNRSPPELVGAKAGSVLFIQANSAGEVPPNKSSIRGDANSLLLLEPLDPITTKVYYAIETDVKGWLPVRVVKAAADDMPLTLAVLRDHLEKELGEEASLSPEAAAKHALHRREGHEDAGGGAIAGAWATKKDLLDTKHLLEKQLKKVAADERQSGLDLSALRNKIKRELADLEKRL